MELLMSLLAAAQDLTPEQSFELSKLAAENTLDMSLNKLGAALGAGLAIVGGGLGIGKLANAAMEGMARQPEAAGDIRGGMILAAALIEGVTLLALITCILAIVL